MKKNKMMRRAAVLMVAVLMSTCAIGGTFAKYTTTSTGSDSARVAKWGVELQVVGNLYGDSYVDNIELDTADKMAVQSSNKADDVVAPGTTNDKGFTFGLNGKPEVAGKIESELSFSDIYLKAGTYAVMIPVDAIVTEANFDEIVGKDSGTDYYYLDGTTYKPVTSTWNASYATLYTAEDVVTLSGAYYPVIYTLSGTSTTYSEGSTSTSSLKAVADAIAANLGLKAPDDPTTATTPSGEWTYVEKTTDTPVYFAPNTDLATEIKLSAETITWDWAFSQSMDGADTILGMLENTTDGTVVKLSGSNYVAVVEYTDYCLDCSFDLKITVTQEDVGQTTAA